jgi:tetratricopeptide (TPR) repeat protein
VVLNRPVRTGHIIRLTTIFGLIVILVGCRPQNESMVRQLSELESPDYRAEQPTDERIRELREGIRTHEEIVRQKVQSAIQLSVYHRLLAIEYINRSMYGLALEQLEEAIRIEPENQVLFYYAGIAAARFGKAMMNPVEREQHFELAEAYYRRAIALDANYISALYALAVLYVFELDLPTEAEPLLDTVVSRQARNVQAMALLARVYAATGRFDEAARMYGRVAELTDDAEVRREAIRNRDLVREAAR